MENINAVQKLIFGHFFEIAKNGFWSKKNREIETLLLEAFFLLGHQK